MLATFIWLFAILASNDELTKDSILATTVRCLPVVGSVRPRQELSISAIQSLTSAVASSSDMVTLADVAARLKSWSQ